MTVNPFTPKGSPFDKQNRLVLDRVKSIKVALESERVKGESFLNRLALDRVKSIKSFLGVKGLRVLVFLKFYIPLTFTRAFSQNILHFLDILEIFSLAMGQNISNLLKKAFST